MQRVLVGLGRIELAEGRWDKASELFERAHRRWRDLDVEDPQAREVARWLAQRRKQLSQSDDGEGGFG